MYIYNANGMFINLANANPVAMQTSLNELITMMMQFSLSILTLQSTLNFLNKPQGVKDW